MPEVLVLQHIDCEPLGIIEDALQRAGLSFRYVRGYAGEPVPREIGDAPGLIVMGGPMGVCEQERCPFLVAEMRLIEQALTRGLPLLGVCLGSQLLATVLGTSVRQGPQKEIGWHPVTLTEDAALDALFQDLPTSFTGFHWHGDAFETPEGAVSLASSALTSCQAFRYGAAAYGILCHMEVTEPMIRAWIAAFSAELADAGLDAASVLGGIADCLPPLQQIGQTVFERWTAQAASLASG